MEVFIFLFLVWLYYISQSPDEDVYIPRVDEDPSPTPPITKKPASKTSNKPTQLKVTKKPYIYSGDQFMSAEDKELYLQSPEWKLISKVVRKKYNWKCAKCSSKQIEVHHITYQRLGAERLEDLVCLCRTHHQLQHNHYGYKRTTIYSPLV